MTKDLREVYLKERGVTLAVALGIPKSAGSITLGLRQHRERGAKEAAPLMVARKQREKNRPEIKTDNSELHPSELLPPTGSHL